MMSAPPIYLDPSQVQLNMPPNFYQPSPSVSVPMPVQTPVTSKTSCLDVLKVLIGLLIAIMLGGIIAKLLFVPHASNEKIAKLLSESNENIARLQREQTLFMEQERQRRQENLMEKYRFEDRVYERQNYERQLSIESQRLERQYNVTEKHRIEDQSIEQNLHEQDLVAALQTSRQQLELEEKRLKILLDEQKLNEQTRNGDLNKNQMDILSEFMQAILSVAKPFNNMIWEIKTHSLLRQLDSTHKSLLIQFLYKFKYLDAKNSTNSTLDLQGATLKDIRLSEMDPELSEFDRRLNYNQLLLPFTNLINASLDRIYFDEATFSMCNMAGASFRGSQGIKANFFKANLTLTRFTTADVSESNFISSNLKRASFINARLSQAHMQFTSIESTIIQDADAYQADFSYSRVSSADFGSTKLVQANFTGASAHLTNFYGIKAMNAEFSGTSMTNCFFQWADLTGASFRYAFLAGSSFENANLVDVDFTGAYLQGVTISQGQLDVVLSVAQATLPDGSKARNKNLVMNSDANCVDINGTISYWNSDGNILIKGDNSSNECVFQAKKVNATLQQTIDLRRYERIITIGKSSIYVEMQETSTGGFNPSNPPASMSLRFFDSNKNQIGLEQLLSDISLLESSPALIATIPCPSATAELQLTIVFHEIDATVDRIYVTIA